MPSKIKYSTKEEALAAITKNGNELKFCSPELRNDEEVVMVAIKEISWAFQYASKSLKSNKTFIMKALHEGVCPCNLIYYSKVNIQSDIEVMTLAVEKGNDGFEFQYTKGKIAFSKELAAKALVKWGNCDGATTDFDLWRDLHPTLQEFFPKDCWYEKAQSYLNQLEQAQMVSGGCTEEDGVVW